MPNQAAKEYSLEIVGLRAVAVLAVLLYHAGMSLPGGYIGVDVFFVISGYLITRLIIDESDRGQFEFKRFYRRRFRRLYPALLATLLLSMLVATVTLHPNHLEQFAKSVMTALLSVSNTYFWTQFGYFDLSAEYKPLLHTWSLGLEEQFYLVWPALVVFLLAPFATRGRLLALLVLGAASLLLSEYWVLTYPSAAYYLLPARVFEFSLGALLLWLPIPRNRQLADGLFLLGLLLIAWSVNSYSASTPFPGLHALLPCIGAALLIQARQCRLGWVLRNRVMVAIGTVSYSVYLVHWPLIVFVRYQRIEPLHPDSKWLLVLASLAIGAALWRLVEQPFRYSPTSANRSWSGFAWTNVVLVAGLSVISSWIWIDRGWAWRYENGAVLTTEQIEQGMQERFRWTFNACKVQSYFDSESCDRERPHQVLILGDSHEADGYNIWRSAFGQLDTQQIISFGSVNDCDLDGGPANQRGRAGSIGCDERIEALRSAAFLREIDTLVYSASRPYSDTAGPFLRLMQWARQINPDLKLVFLGGYLMLREDCSAVFNNTGSFRACNDPNVVGYGPHDEQAERLLFTAKFAALLGDLEPTYVSKFDLLCTDTDACPSNVQSIPFAWDAHHLSFEFANYTGRLVRDQYESQFREAGVLPTATLTAD